MQAKMNAFTTLMTILSSARCLCVSTCAGLAGLGGLMYPTAGIIE